MSTMTAAPTLEATRQVTTAEPTRYLTFTLNGEAYALDIFHVTEIIEHRRLTGVPMMPSCVPGVINLRGRAVPVIDLAIRFGRAPTTIARRTSIVIVSVTSLGGGARPASGAGTGAGHQELGILVDAVNKVVDFDTDDIEPAPDFGVGVNADYISGMARTETGFIIVLDIDHILSMD